VADSHFSVTVNGVPKRARKGSERHNSERSDDEGEDAESRMCAPNAAFGTPISSKDAHNSSDSEMDEVLERRIECLL